MACAREYSLFQLPGVNVASLEHVAAVIGFDDDCRATAQAFSYKSCDVAEVHQGSNADSSVRCSKSEIVCGIVWNGERVKINRAYLEITARFNLFGPVAQGV